MSTSTLGFEREERKILYDEYLFQRRVLFGITISIIFAAFVWTIAICTDDWIVVKGNEPIFISYSERFFKSSRTGLWRVCRYALTPILLANSTLPQLLTKLIVTNATEISRLKKDINSEPYIDVWAHISITNATSVDNRFKQALFAKWIRQSNDFQDFKVKYRAFAFPPNATQATVPLYVNGKKIEPHVERVDSIRPGDEAFGYVVVNVHLNATNQANVVMPKALHSALFDEWPQTKNVVYLLEEYARALNLSTAKLPNGLSLVLRPPDPPSKGYKSADYHYIEFEKCQYHNFFPLINETEYDPEIDDVLLGRTNDTLDEKKYIQHKDDWEDIQDYLRTQASFACICLLIMTMAFVFSMYTFLNPRYMFKRLAAGVHFISASICFVVLQIVSIAVQYEQGHMHYLFPEQAEYYYGYGVYMAWAVFIVNASACFLFLWYSKKRKGNKAPTEELAMADEPIGLGR